MLPQRLKGKKVLLAMQPKSVLSPGLNGIQEGVIYHAMKLQEMGAEVTLVSDMRIPGFNSILFGKEGEEGDFAFRVRKSRSMMDLVTNILEMHKVNKYDIIQVKGHFHMTRGLEVLKNEVGPDVKVVGSFHNYSDVGLSVMQSSLKMINAIKAGVHLDFLTRGCYENWWTKCGQQFIDEQMTTDESIEYFENRVHYLLNPVIPHMSIEEALKNNESRLPRIAYIGRLTNSKGVVEIMRLAKESKLVVDFYGPIADKEVEDWFAENKEDVKDYVNYLGVIPQGPEVTEVMMKYSGVIIWSRSVDISNRTMIKAAGLGIPTLVCSDGMGNREVAGMLGEKYQSYIPQRTQNVMRFKAWSVEFAKAYESIVNMTLEDRIELAEIAREVFDVDVWANKLADLYLV